MSIPYPFLPSGGELAVSSTEDVLAAWPAKLRDQEDAPVRDALVEAQLAMFLAHQERSDYAAAQCDPTRATGQYLHGHAADREVYAQENEPDEQLRNRLYAVPNVVTPPSILGAVNQILSGYTDKTAKMFESISDRMFLGDGTTTWHSFMGDGISDIDPQYQDRRYDMRDGAGPGGAWLFSENYGRYFVLRIPDITGIGDPAPFMYDSSQVLDDHGPGFFLNDGSITDGSISGFMYNGAADGLSVYQAIVNTVEQIRGHGVRWTLRVDKKL